MSHLVEACECLSVLVDGCCEVSAVAVTETLSLVVMRVEDGPLQQAPYTLQYVKGRGWMIGDADGPFDGQWPMRWTLAPNYDVSALLKIIPALLA